MKKSPSYRQRPGYTQAIVTLTDSRSGKRRDYWLGEHGTPESRERYHLLIAEWEAGGSSRRPVHRPRVLHGDYAGLRPGLSAPGAASASDRGRGPSRDACDLACPAFQSPEGGALRVAEGPPLAPPPTQAHSRDRDSQGLRLGGGAAGAGALLGGHHRRCVRGARCGKGGGGAEEGGVSFLSRR